MKITAPVTDTHLRPSFDREPAPRSQGRSGSGSPLVDRVEVSLAARAAAELRAAGADGPAEVAVVQGIVGSGPPNSKMKEQVVMLLVDMLTDRRLRELRTSREEPAAGGGELPTEGGDPVPADPAMEAESSAAQAG